jgi:hypothetical protein
VGSDIRLSMAYRAAPVAAAAGPSVDVATSLSIGWLMNTRSLSDARAAGRIHADSSAK